MSNFEQGKEENQAFIVAKDLADKVCAAAGIEKKVLAECDAIAFKNAHAEPPKNSIQFTSLVLIQRHAPTIIGINAIK